MGEYQAVVDAIRKGPEQVIGFERNGAQQKAFEMGWNAAKEQVWAAIPAHIKAQLQAIEEAY